MTHPEKEKLLDKAEEANKKGNYDEAERLANQVLAEVEIRFALYADALVSLAHTACNRGNYNDALLLAEKALAFAELHSHKESKANAFNIFGNVYRILADYGRALDYFHKALAVNQEIESKLGIANNLNNIGTVYNALADFPRALEYYHQALAIKEEIGRKKDVANTIANIAIVYNSLAEYTVALEYYQKALAINEEVGYKFSIAQNLGDIGITYENLFEFSRAMEHYQQALAIFEELGGKFSIAIILGDIGNLYADYTFEGYDAIKAEEYLMKAVAIGEEIGAKHHLCNVFKSLTELSKNEKRWEEFVEYYKKYHELYIEVQNEEVKQQANRYGWERKIAEMEKEKEIQAIKVEGDRRFLEETISFQKRMLEQQARELKNTIEELVRKNSLLQLIQSDIKKIAQYIHHNGIDYIEQLFNRVSRNIIPLGNMKELDKQLSDVHGSFMTELQLVFPNLTTMELKIAALLNMKLTSSNIAAALSISPRTVESHRFSIRRKMGLATNINIYQELAKYSIIEFTEAK